MVEPEISIFQLVLLVTVATSAVGKLDTFNEAGNKASPVCNTAECKQAAHILRSSMDLSARPCVNFYKFACGTYAKLTPLNGKQSRSWMLDLRDQIVDKVKDYLNRPPSNGDPAIINSLRELYKQCVDIDTMDKLAYGTFRTFLQTVQLSILPIYDKNQQIDWLSTMALLIQTGTVNFMFDISVFGEANNQQVNTVYITKSADKPILGYQWSREVGDLELVEYPNDDSFYVPDKDVKIVEAGNDENARKDDSQESKTPSYNVDEIKVDTSKKPAFVKFLLESMKLLSDHFQLGSVVDLGNSQLLQDLDKLFDFIYKRAVIQRSVYLDKMQQKMMTIRDLQKKTDKIMKGNNVINWAKLLNLVFQPYTSPPYEFDEYDSIGMYGLEYIRRALSLIAKTENRIIEMAMWYDCLTRFAPVTTKALRQLYYKFKEENEQPPTPTMEEQCAKTIMSKYAMAVSYMFTKEPDAHRKKYRVQVMTDLILRVFKKTLTRANWINQNTKVSALEKAARMRTYVGFPLWLGKHEEVNDFYAGFPIQYADFLTTMIHFNMLKTRLNLSILFNSNNPDRPGYSMFPTVVNACYNQNSNSLTIPYASLHLPYYNYGIDSLNFGSMGVIISHEVTHGFDNNGKNYDLRGNGNPWMTKDTTKKFRDGAKCFVKSYGQLFVEELGVNVNGELTLNENIADNGGLAIAYEAYQLYKNRYGDKILPGFEGFTQEQLFTIGFAMTMCSHFSKKAFDILIVDEHTPSEQRVNGMMMNFAEFPKIWGCPLNTPMNPPNKCKIW